MDEILKRLDQHMARGNELIERVDNHFELNRRAFEVMIETLAHMGQAIKQQTDEVRELSEESRAQTKAIFRLIDERLDGGASPA